MSLPARYNPRFIKHYNDTGVADLQTLGEYGVSIIVARSTDPTCYRCIGVHHLSGQENGGKHHIFIDVLDEQGQRVSGSLIRVQVGNNPPTYAPVDKPASEPGTNAPMWANTQYSIAVANSPSDTVIGLHTGHPDEPGGGNTWGHHSFYLVFQRRAVGQPEPIKPVPPVIPPPPIVPPRPNDEGLLAIHDMLELILKNQAVQVLALKRIEEKQDANDQRMKKTAAVWQQ